MTHNNEREQRAERDKLATVIETAYDLNPGMASFELLAHAILAAGYVKPRQVKSLAELEALPPESAVQTSDTSDTVVLKGSDGLFINAFGGEVGAETLWSFGAKPFFVIYEPVGSL